MCLGVPGRIVEVRGETALVDFGDGVVREVLVGPIEEPRPGDIVVVHAGVAIARVSREAAERQKRLLEELLDHALDRLADSDALKALEMRGLI